MIGSNRDPIDGDPMKTPSFCRQNCPIKEKCTLLCEVEVKVATKNEIKNIA